MNPNTKNDPQQQANNPNQTNKPAVAPGQNPSQFGQGQDGDKRNNPLPSTQTQGTPDKSRQGFGGERKDGINGPSSNRDEGMSAPPSKH